MACTIKRDALIQQHAALGRTLSFALRPRKPRSLVLVDAALSIEASISIEASKTSPSLSCPQLLTPGMPGEHPQEYWRIARPFYRLARLPTPPLLAEMVSPPSASPTQTDNRKVLAGLKTSRLMRYYGPHLLSLTVSTLDIGQLERKMTLIAKRVLGAWRLCTSGEERERERERERETRRVRARASESKIQIKRVIVIVVVARSRSD